MSWWEWRVFFSAPAGTARNAEDVWELLGRKPPAGEPERRSDVYVVCTGDAGIKLRSGRSLEIKLTECRHESGAQFLYKLHGEADVTLKAAIVKCLGSVKVSGRDTLRDSLESALAVTSESSELSCVLLHKSRKAAAFGGAYVEQTDITSDSFSDLRWRSVCVECSRLDRLLKVLKTNTNSSSDTVSEHLLKLAGKPESYADFVVHLWHGKE